MCLKYLEPRRALLDSPTARKQQTISRSKAFFQSPWMQSEENLVPCGLRGLCHHLSPALEGHKEKSVWVTLRACVLDIIIARCSSKASRKWTLKIKKLMTSERSCVLQLSEARELASPQLDPCLFHPSQQLPCHRVCFVKDPQETMRENSFCLIRLDQFMCLGEGGVPPVTGGADSGGPCGHFISNEAPW